MIDQVLKIKAYAKINISLDVLGKRADGYHDVKMIMQSVSVHDIVNIALTNGGIVVKCNRDNIPSGESNIAWKAAKLFFDEVALNYGLDDYGADIFIEKIIPVAAGLAGGSADAAAVLRGLNLLMGSDNLGEGLFSISKLCEIGSKVGADVPFCIIGGTMLSEGIGDILTPLKPMKRCHIVLIKPPIDVSTAWVYKNLILNEVLTRPDTNEIISAIEAGDILSVASKMKNVLENVTEKEYPVIGKIKQALIQLGAIGSMMSGSGPTVFGLFDDEEIAKNARDMLETIDEFKGSAVFVTEPISI